MSPARLSAARLVLPTRVGLGIAIVLVAAGGRLAMPAAADPHDAAAIVAPAPTRAPSSAPATVKPPAPKPKPSPTSTPTYTPPTYSPPAVSRYATRTPVVTPSPTYTHRSSSAIRSYSSSSSASSSASSSSGGDPRSIARAMLASRGWGNQFSCLDPLWTRESGWSATAGSPGGPYGIPQANPGTKMASAGSDWRTNPRTQIAWGLNYIASTYGSPCAAWGHSQSTGWY